MQVSLDDVDEFSKVRTRDRPPAESDVIDGVRELHETEELEPALQRILRDPNDTPHGPTELADIVTNVTIDGDTVCGAFVLKGKSLKRVTNKEVAHQLVRPRRIPDLGLLALFAVGSVQDDVREELARQASDEGAHYLLADAGEIARLLVSYEEMCPRDGTVFGEEGKCAYGHERDSGVEIGAGSRDDIEYEIVRLKDVSHGLAKRYSAFVVAHSWDAREDLKELVSTVTDEVKGRQYHRSEQVAEKWEGEEASVVWVYVAFDLRDVRNNNWVCRSQWIESSLAEEARPSTLEGEEVADGLIINWNESYEQFRKMHRELEGTKGEVITEVGEVIDEIVRLGKAAQDAFEAYKEGRIQQDEFEALMSDRVHRVRELDQAMGEVPLPPDEVEEYYWSAQAITDDVSNMYQFFTDDGFETWERQTRECELEHLTTDFEEDIERFRYERDKVH